MTPDKTRDADPAVQRSRRFTYADYIELRGWEFEKFRNMPAIDENEASATDWDSLLAEFLTPAEEES